MVTVDSRVKGGKLTFTSPDGGASVQDYSCQATAVAIVPSVNESDSVEVLCGQKIGGGSTTDDKLEFTIISDHGSVNGLVAFSWKNRGKTVDFEWVPDADPSNKWTGKVVDQALKVGGEVGSQLSVEGSWTIVSVTPPAAYGDGQIHSNPVPSKSAAKPGDVFPAEATVTASDATNAAKLSGLGYTASPNTAWTSGQKITVGTFDFHWTGSAWAAAAATK